MITLHQINVGDVTKVRLIIVLDLIEILIKLIKIVWQKPLNLSQVSFKEKSRRIHLHYLMIPILQKNTV